MKFDLSSLTDVSTIQMITENIPAVVQNMIAFCNKLPDGKLAGTFELARAVGRRYNYVHHFINWPVMQPYGTLAVLNGRRVRVFGNKRTIKEFIKCIQSGRR